MHDHSGPMTTTAHLPTEGYDQAPVWNGQILLIGVGLVLMIGTSYLISLWLFDLFKSESVNWGPKRSDLAAKERPQLPADLTKIPSPRLQEHEMQDINQFRQWEHRQLTTYGWTDLKQGTVRIPINEAVKMLSDPSIARKHGIRSEALKEGVRP